MIVCLCWCEENQDVDRQRVPYPRAGSAPRTCPPVRPSVRPACSCVPGLPVRPTPESRSPPALPALLRDADHRTLTATGSLQTASEGKSPTPNEHTCLQSDRTSTALLPTARIPAKPSHPRRNAHSSSVTSPYTDGSSQPGVERPWGRGTAVPRHTAAAPCCSGGRAL